MLQSYSDSTMLIYKPIYHALLTMHTKHLTCHCLSKALSALSVIGSLHPPHLGRTVSVQQWSQYGWPSFSLQVMLPENCTKHPQHWKCSGCQLRSMAVRQPYSGNIITILFYVFCSPQLCTHHIQHTWRESFPCSVSHKTAAHSYHINVRRDGWEAVWRIIFAKSAVSIQCIYTVGKRL